MAKKRKDGEFRFHDRVVSTSDIPGVPIGTPGRVILVNGFAWIRYRVMFDNGLDVGTLDYKQLSLADKHGNAITGLSDDDDSAPRSGGVGLQGGRR